MKNARFNYQRRYIFAILVSVVLALLGCSSVQPPVSTPTPVASPNTLSPQVVVVPINVDGADKLGSLEFVLAYEAEALEVLKVQKGDLAYNALLEFSELQPGKVWTGIVDGNGISGDGTVAMVSFRVRGEHQGSTELTLEDVSVYHATTLLDIHPEASAGNLSPGSNSVISPSLSFR